MQSAQPAGTGVPAPAQQPPPSAPPAPAQVPSAPNASVNNGPSQAGSNTKCSKCGQTQQALKAANLRLKPCPCRKAQYCNQECQKEDWKRHKVECTYSRPRAKPAAQAVPDAASGPTVTAVQQPQPQQQPQQQQPLAQPLKSPNMPPSQNPQFSTQQQQQQQQQQQAADRMWNKTISTAQTASTPAAPQQRPTPQPQPQQQQQQQQLRNVARSKFGNETQGLIDKNNLSALRQLLLIISTEVPGAVDTIDQWARRQPMQQQQMLQPPIPMLQQGGLNQITSPMISQQMLPMQSMSMLQHPLMMPGFSLIPNTTGLTMGTMNPGIAGLQAAGTTGLQGSPFQLATTGGVISPITTDALRLGHQGR